MFFWGLAVIFFWHFLQSGKDWAIFPGGILTTLGLVCLVDGLRLPHRLETMVFMFGLAATFAGPCCGVCRL